MPTKQVGLNLVGIKLPPLVEDSQEGMTLFENRMILIREDYEFFQTLPESPPYTKRQKNLLLALYHEGIHFFGGFTQAFPYMYMLDLMKLCYALKGYAQEGMLDAAALRSFRDKYNSYNYCLTNEKYGLSAIDLFEAIAITESFRITLREHASLSNFERFLEEYRREGDSVYTKVIDIVNSNFGIEAALELTPRLCFLALNGTTPARNFQIFIKELRELPIIGLHSLTVLELCEIMGLDPANLFLNKYKELDKKNQVIFLTPYFEKLHTMGSYSKIIEYAARPSNFFTEKNPEFIKLFVAPVTMFSNGRYFKSEFYSQLSKDDQDAYVLLAGLMGACERLLLKDELYQYCPHEKCPIRETNLCHMWYGVPQRIHWTKCGFPKNLKYWFNMDANDLMQLRTDSFK